MRCANCFTCGSVAFDEAMRPISTSAMPSAAAFSRNLRSSPPSLPELPLEFVEPLVLLLADPDLLMPLVEVPLMLEPPAEPALDPPEPLMPEPLVEEPDLPDEPEALPDPP